MTDIIADSAGRSRLRVILAASVGSALEWYDFFLYGTAAALVFGDLFFPRSDPIVGTLLSFLTFGVGFVVRPQAGAGGDTVDDRHRHDRDRPTADLCPDRLLGAGAARADARDPRLGRRRRIWRGGHLSRRERAGASSRLLGQFCAARRLDRQPACGRRLCAGDAITTRRSDVMGLAPAVPGKLPAHRGRRIRSPARGGNPGLYRGGGRTRQGRAKPGDGSAAPASAKLHGGVGGAARRKWPW